MNLLIVGKWYLMSKQLDSLTYTHKLISLDINRSHQKQKEGEISSIHLHQMKDGYVIFTVKFFVIWWRKQESCFFFKLGTFHLPVHTTFGRSWSNDRDWLFLHSQISRKWKLSKKWTKFSSAGQWHKLKVSEKLNISEFLVT